MIEVSGRVQVANRPEPCNDYARTFEQCFQLHGIETAPVIGIVPESADFEVAIEPQPRRPRLGVPGKRPGIVGAVLAHGPRHTAAIGERDLLHLHLGLVTAISAACCKSPAKPEFAQMARCESLPRRLHL